MILPDKILSWISFLLLSVTVLVSPWLFAAWEMWLFWPFVVLIFLSAFCFSLRLLLKSRIEERDVEGQGRNVSVMKVLPVAGCVLFLAYAFVRFMQADVFMDAERSFLLFFSPFLIGIQIVFGFDRRQLRLIMLLILVNFLLLGLYGIINHVICKSVFVLWRAGYPQYIGEVRATGSYFCPDHYSGLMELALCLALGILLARGRPLARKVFAAALAVVAVAGVLMSKSRGGGLTLVVVGLAVLVWGFSQWPVAMRWYLRMAIGAIAGLALFAFCHFESSYMVRFKSHFGWEQSKARPFKEVVSVAKERLVSSCRGQMISAALRAWRERPVFGIGAGMHQNLWPHYAPSPDGDREFGIWPTHLNNDFHSYEVHSDWVQLLEEYGIVGFVLFLVMAGLVVGVLVSGFRNETSKWAEGGRVEVNDGNYAPALGGILSCVAMAFHSLGDFNLQMPATVWLMAVIVAVPMALVLNADESQ